MKKCISGWIHGGFNFRSKFSSRDIEQISRLLSCANKYMPNEFHRAVRELDTLRFWKGVEFRTFLLYLGPVILKNFLHESVYQHFLILCCGVTICTTSVYEPFIDIADSLFRDYVESYIHLYGIDSIGSNVHNLIHIVEDVKRFGPLPNISAYPFENALCRIKRLLRHGNLPLSQIAKRLVEQTFTNNLVLRYSENEYKLIAEKENVEENHKLPDCGKVYESVRIEGEYCIKPDSKNKWFMTADNKIVAMINAKIYNGQIHIYGYPLKKCFDFWEHPFKSSFLNIYLSSGKFENAELFNVEKHRIKAKMICLPYNGNFVYFPLLHSLK